MRAALVACIAAISTGCSVLDGVNLEGSRTLDPSKVYLGQFDKVRTNRRQVHQFDCLNDAPLVCKTSGLSMDCHCAY